MDGANDKVLHLRRAGRPSAEQDLLRSEGKPPLVPFLGRLHLKPKDENKNKCY
jgi:hypothetical protein